MNTSKPRFHQRLPTDIDHEIALAEALYSAGIVRHGQDGFRIRLRTDPAGFFRQCHYIRYPLKCECIVALGFKADEAYVGFAIKPTNDEILTPSHPAFGEFSDRLLSELVAHDYEWNYAPLNDDYWPLASAVIIRDMGFAVAETLTVYQAFLGEKDRKIHDHVEGFWWRTKPRKGMVPFDASLL